MTLSKTTAILLLTAAVTAPAFAKKDKTKAETAPAAPTTTAAAGSGDSRPAATVGGSRDHDGRARPCGGQPAREGPPARVRGARGHAHRVDPAEADRQRSRGPEGLRGGSPQDRGRRQDRDADAGRGLAVLREDTSPAWAARRSTTSRATSRRCSRARRPTSAAAQFLTELSAKNEVKMHARAAAHDGHPAPGSPVDGPGRRAGHDRRVVRLPVPVLQARASDRRAGLERVQGQGPLRLPRLSAPVPPDGDAGRPGGSLRRGPGQVLGIPHEPLRGRRRPEQGRPHQARARISGSTPRRSRRAPPRTSTSV